MIIAQNDRKAWAKDKLASQHLSDQRLTNLIIENRTLDYSHWLDCLGAEQLVDSQEYPSVPQNQMINNTLT
ncbi:hypothetical protein ACRRS0_05810 [Agarivorans sp. QJM3NY_29]|uniref:hypothetical protein n=1 Tax=unclassified Agarivorans TaxID=2636026 RepID=UPI003D7F00BC